MMSRDPLTCAFSTAVIEADRVMAGLQRLRVALQKLPSDLPAEYRDEIATELGELAASMTALRGGIGLAEDSIDRSRAFGKLPPSPVSGASVSDVKI